MVGIFKIMPSQSSFDHRRIDNVTHQEFDDVIDFIAARSSSAFLEESQFFDRTDFALSSSLRNSCSNKLSTKQTVPARADHY